MLVQDCQAKDCPGVRGVTEWFWWCFAWSLRRVRTAVAHSKGLSTPDHSGSDEMKEHSTLLFIISILAVIHSIINHQILA